MRWYLRHWYDVGLGVCIIVLACGVVIELNTIQQILLLSFAVLLLHEFEEYGWPGGMPVFMNIVMRHSERPDRYPLNQLNSLVVNVPAGYAFYAVPLFLDHVIWLGLGVMLFGFLEVLLHVLGGCVKAKSLYNGGLATVVPWLALGIWYIAEVNSHNLVQSSDW
jgi:peptidoglycan biosynthesis protein MviN/MurJ (putative lipid II flippase)